MGTDASDTMSMGKAGLFNAILLKITLSTIEYTALSGNYLHKGEEKTYQINLSIILGL